MTSPKPCRQASKSVSSFAKLSRAWQSSELPRVRERIAERCPGLPEDLVRRAAYKAYDIVRREGGDIDDRRIDNATVCTLRHDVLPYDAARTALGDLLGVPPDHLPADIHRALQGMCNDLARLALNHMRQAATAERPRTPIPWPPRLDAPV